jgi:hypothetical protein
MSPFLIDKGECIRASEELDRDIQLYATLVAQIGCPPTPDVLMILGTEARLLAERRASHAKDWVAFRALVRFRHPDLLTWIEAALSSDACANNHGEFIAYKWLRGFLPPDIKIEFHEPTHPARPSTADFLLVSEARRIHVKVAIPAADGLTSPAIISIEKTC